MFEFTVVAADIMQYPCDLLILKHAEGFYGVDGLVADRIGFRDRLALGDHAFVAGRDIGAREVLFVGVGPLYEFRYERMRGFAAQALELAADRTIERACSPVHGPGYGLDERESFLSLIGGFTDALQRKGAPLALRRIDIVEINPYRAARLAGLLAPITDSRSSPLTSSQDRTLQPDVSLHRELRSFGAGSETKPHLFVAMPYASKHSDVWEVAILDMSAKVGVAVEKMDLQSFVGDIVSEMKNRIAQASGMIALLDGANANVFLELGFAWALNKPTILLSKKGSKIPFDVRGQRYLQYESINDLRTKLIAELEALVEKGVFSRT